MSVYRRIEKLFLKLLMAFWSLFIFIHEYKNIWKKRHIWKQVELTKEQRNQIDNYYIQNYGKRVPYWWHRLYYSYTHRFDYRFIPEILFSTKLEPKYISRIQALQYENKNMIDILTGGGCELHLFI